MPLICMPVRIAEIVQAERIGGLCDRCKFPCVGPAVIEYTAATPGHPKGIQKRIFRHGQRKDCRAARARSSQELRKANNEELVIRLTAIRDALEKRDDTQARQGSRPNAWEYRKLARIAVDAAEALHRGHAAPLTGTAVADLPEFGLYSGDLLRDDRQPGYAEEPEESYAFCTEQEEAALDNAAGAAAGVASSTGAAAGGGGRASRAMYIAVFYFLKPTAHGI